MQSPLPDNRDSGQERDPAALAIERVLAAERAAEESLRDGRQHAEAIVAAARERAAAITRRADARISRLHTDYLQKIDRSIAELPSRQSGNSAVFADDTALARAAGRLAARLAGDL